MDDSTLFFSYASILVSVYIEIFLYLDTHPKSQRDFFLSIKSFELQGINIHDESTRTSVQFGKAA